LQHRKADSTVFLTRARKKALWVVAGCHFHQRRCYSGGPEMLTYLTPVDYCGYISKPLQSSHYCRQVAVVRCCRLRRGDARSIPSADPRRHRHSASISTPASRCCITRANLRFPWCMFTVRPEQSVRGKGKKPLAQKAVQRGLACCIYTLLRSVHRCVSPCSSTALHPLSAILSI
jgi:hypothetical protein